MKESEFKMVQKNVDEEWAVLMEKMKSTKSRAQGVRLKTQGRGGEKKEKVKV